MKKTARFISLRGLASSLALSAIPFCLRSDNAMLSSFERGGTTVAFAGTLLVGIAIACVIVFSCSKGSRLVPRVGFACFALALATVFASDAAALPAYLGAALAGVLFGFSLPISVFGWCSTISSKDPGKTLLAIGAALFCASVISYFIALFANTAALCAVLLVLGAVSLIAAESASNSASEATAKREPFPLIPLSNAKAILSFGWGGIAGIAFNFFTLGLTFWPADAGLASGEASATKPVAYALVLLVSFAAASRARSAPSSSLELFYRLALPVAAAIVLASPFLETAVTVADVPVVSSFPYLGIALLNFLGLTSAVWIATFSKASLGRILSFMFACCAVAMGAGMLVFQALGQQAQIVSLCILALYLVIMVFTTIRESTRQNATAQIAQTAQDQLSGTCQLLAENYALSPREEEILEYLARGRGSRYIADKLCISAETVRTHSKRIYDKMDVHTKEELLDLIENQE